MKYKKKTNDQAVVIGDHIVCKTSSSDCWKSWPSLAIGKSHAQNLLSTMVMDVLSL